MVLHIDSAGSAVRQLLKINVSTESRHQNGAGMCCVQHCEATGYDTASGLRRPLV